MCSLLNRIPKCNLHIHFEQFQDGDSTAFLGSLFLCLTTLLANIFPNIYSKPPPVQLKSVSCSSVTCYLGEAPTWLQPPSRGLQREMNLLYSRINTFSSLSCSDMCSRLPSLVWYRSTNDKDMLKN